MQQMYFNLIAMASNLLAMASNLTAMATNRVMYFCHRGNTHSRTGSRGRPFGPRQHSPLDLHVLDWTFVRKLGIKR